MAAQWQLVPPESLATLTAIGQVKVPSQRGREMDEKVSFPRAFWKIELLLYI